MKYFKFIMKHISYLINILKISFIINNIIYIYSRATTNPRVDNNHEKIARNSGSTRHKIQRSRIKFIEDKEKSTIAKADKPLNIYEKDDVLYSLVAYLSINTNSDPKEIIDRPIKNYEQLIKDFQGFLQSHGKEKYELKTQQAKFYLNKEQIKELMDIYEKYFLNDYSDIEKVVPDDYNTTMMNTKLTKIKNKTMKEILNHINNKWLDLCRNVSKKVADVNDSPRSIKNKSQEILISSIIPLENYFFIPGGRLKELYYWDTYFMMRGLLVSKMYISAFKCLDNLLFLIEKYGYIPNGNRIYYLERSNPPFLGKIVECIYSELYKISKNDIYNLDVKNQGLDYETEHKAIIKTLTQKITNLENSNKEEMDARITVLKYKREFVKKFTNEYTEKIILSLKKEKYFFDNNRIVKKDDEFINCEKLKDKDLIPFKDLILNRYYSDSNTPRLESLGYDIKVYEYYNYDFYRNIKAACESGWDFSSRWCGQEVCELATTLCTKQIPVDLNTLLLKNTQILRKMEYKYTNFDKTHNNITHRSNNKLDNNEDSENVLKNYDLEIENRKKSIYHFLFNETVHLWNDYNFHTSRHVSKHIYLSNFYPILLDTDYYLSSSNLKNFEVNDKQQYESKILYQHIDYLFGFRGGVPISTDHKVLFEHQWDYPNSFPPLITLLYTFFRETNNIYITKNNLNKDISFHIAKCFYDNVHAIYKDKGELFEKYKSIPGEVIMKNDEKRNKLGVEIMARSGEYENQVGFGWTNSLLLMIINDYGDELVTKELENIDDRNKNNSNADNPSENDNDKDKYTIFNYEKREFNKRFENIKNKWKKINSKFTKSN